MRYGFGPYVSVGERREQAREYAKKLAKKGRKVSPVEIDGRTIASSFWGKAWCDHLESYSDFENRLPRGRRYVRNGSVIDLQITPGKVQALVSGSAIYEIEVEFKPLDKQRWTAIKRQCAGQIASVVELLRGRLSDAVMRILTDRDAGLFPAPSEIKLECSCPDWADMCKHVAAVLYGVGSRLDHQPELLFTLRQVDQAELIEAAGSQLTAVPAGEGAGTIADENLADVFGIDVESDVPVPAGTAVAATQATDGKRVPAAKRGKAAKRKSPGRTKTKAKVAGTDKSRRIAAAAVTSPVVAKSRKAGTVRVTKRRSAKAALLSGS